MPRRGTYKVKADQRKAAQLSEHRERVLLLTESETMAVVRAAATYKPEVQQFADTLARGLYKLRLRESLLRTRRLAQQRESAPPKDGRAPASP